MWVCLRLPRGHPPVAQRLPFRLGSPFPRLQTVRAVMTGFGLCAGVDCCAPCRNWGCVLAWTVAHHAVIDAMGRRMQTKRRGCAVINAASSPMLICRDLRPVSPSCERRYTYLTKLSVLAMMPADLQGVSPCTIKSLHNQATAQSSPCILSLMARQFWQVRMCCMCCRPSLMP